MVVIIKNVYGCNEIELLYVRSLYERVELEQGTFEGLCYKSQDITLQLS